MYCPLLRFIIFFLLFAGYPCLEIIARGQTVDTASQRRILVVAKENYNQGNYPEAMKAALAVYESASRADDKVMMADAGNMIGLVELAQGDAQVALNFFRRALRLNTNIGNKARVAANLLNIGLAHSDMKQLDSTVISLKKSLEVSRAQGLKNLVAMGRNHLGDTYLRLGNLGAAEIEFRHVLEDRGYQSDWENSFASTGMAQLCLERGDFAKAAAYAGRAYRLALASKAKWDASRALELSHKAYWGMGDAHKAYDRLLVFKTYTDSLFNADRERDLNGMRLRAKSFENENLQNHIQLVNQERRMEKLLIAFALVGLLLFAILAVLIYRRLRRTIINNRMLRAEKEATLLHSKVVESQNETLNMINRDHNRLFSIIGHDLRSPFASIERTLALFKSGDLDQGELIVLSEKLSAQLDTASGMLNSLLLWSANQMGGISFSPVAFDLCAKVEKVVQVAMIAASYKKIKLVHAPVNLPGVLGDADQVRIMIQNLVSNAIKFTPEGGMVKISYLVSLEHVDLLVEDNGIGISPEKLRSIFCGETEQVSTYGTSMEKGIGLGLHLVRDFAANNQISFSGSSEVGEGTTFVLRFHTVLRKGR
ncbi:ATP-binding protein [Pedobacter ureilyticus]|uniref:histidine kinase n=1 Tax=Pedobacter ureilyticus TaxID=1393051 RepID=A0ABW9J866_9SPHI|nr:HAMP domain-containing sensor histidine kinase [Pedobacter helvus]